MINKNFTILIVEDDYHAKEALKGYLQNLGYFKIVEAKSSQEAEEICRTNYLTLAFLDIGLKDSELDGIGLGKRLNAFTDAAIVFTTSFTDSTTIDRADAVDHQIYIPKPVRERDVVVAIRKALKDKSKPKLLFRTGKNQCVFQDQEEDIYIKGKDKFYKRINVNEIVYIKADSGGVMVYTLTSGKLFTYTTLTSFLRQYRHDDIIKVHLGHAVNKKHISAKSESLIRMIDGTELPIGMKWRAKIGVHFQLIKPKA